jgi:hypothetical protein
MRQIRRPAFAVMLVTVMSASAAAADGAGLPIPCEAIDSVGTATMAVDGTIALRVRSLWPQPFAERQLVYAPVDAQYENVKRHLGGIAPGQAKPVPPLCGTNAEP